MTAFTRWTLRSVALAVAVASTTPASAQVVQPQANPKGNPQAQQPNPFGNFNPRNPVKVMPSINTLPGIPAALVYPPAFQSPFLNPALDNPWMNPVVIRPRPVNPFAFNPLFNNPFALNPLLQNPAFNNNPFGIPGYGPNPYANYSPNLFNPNVSYTPPVAFKQPGYMLYKGPDLQVNPASGTVYRPLSGVATLKDGSTFYYVPGTGVPTASGKYAPGTGLYYNPQGNTFFNPSSGVVSKPGQTNVFVPYVW